jgi:hypothetical protein
VTVRSKIGSCQGSEVGWSSGALDGRSAAAEVEVEEMAGAPDVAATLADPVRFEAAENMGKMQTA